MRNKLAAKDKREEPRARKDENQEQEIGRYVTNHKPSKVLDKFNLTFVSRGPNENGWKGSYLKCQICEYYFFKGPGYDECTYGNISIDSDMLRVTVQKSSESEVEIYNAYRKKDANKQ